MCKFWNESKTFALSNNEEEKWSVK
jgi:hypothetical protein